MTFITPREKSYLHVVEKTTRKKMERMKAPTLDEALEGQQKAAIEKICKRLNLIIYNIINKQLMNC